MTQLFVTDMDHTLLDDESRLPENFGDILIEVRKQNKVMVLASGRTLVSIKNKVKDYLPELCIISDNGGIVEKYGTIEYIDEIPKEEVAEIIGVLRQAKNTTIIAASVNNAYIEMFDEEHSKNLVEYYPNYTAVDDILKVEEPILKITTFSYNDTVSNFESIVFPQLGDKFNTVVAGVLWIDVMNKHTDKGHGLAKLSELLGIDAKDIVAFGDYNNDIGMLTYAGTSYAVENAHDDVKNVTDYVIGSNNENSVLKKISEIINI